MEPSLPRSSPVLKRLCSFHSLDVGMVAVLLVAVAIVVSARDALENNGNLHEDVDGQVTSTRDAFEIVAPLANVVE